jgi:2-dehydropantoate 2-reductase
MSGRVAVLGPGGVGGFLAAALDRAGTPTTLIAREPTAEALRARDGLAVTSALLGDFTAAPRIATALEDEADLLLIATKAGGLPEALARIEAEPGLVVPLLNGIEHLAVLRERFGAERVPAAVIRIESDRPRAGVIVQSSPVVRIDLAADDPALARRLPAAAALLRGAGLEVRVGDSEAAVMWAKLCRLCTLALTTSAADRPLGEIRADPRGRSAMENAIAEVVAVARAEGAPSTVDSVTAELESAPATLSSSRRRDLAAGREPELDAIAGAVIRAGLRHELPCPTIQWLAERVALRAAAARPDSGAAQNGGRTGSAGPSA